MKTNEDKLDAATEAEIESKSIRIIVKAAITNQLALFYNEEIKHTPYYRRELKRSLNLLLPHLIKIEKTVYEGFATHVGEQADIVHDTQYYMTEELSTLEPPEFFDMIQIIKAYKKNPKSIKGIAKKILT
jgi:hypothetical protein